MYAASFYLRAGRQSRNSLLSILLVPGMFSKLTDQLHHFAGVGMALGARFGEYFLPVQGHLEAPFRTSYKGDGFNIRAKRLDKLSRQTGGAWPVASFLTVQDLHFHCLVPPSDVVYILIY